MRKITMIDKLTIFIVNKNEYKIEIDEKFTNISSLEDIEELELPLSNFFEVESFGQQNSKIYFIYRIPSDYTPFTVAKNYEPVIKLQLIKELLDNDPLLECEGKTYLDLSNIFYKDFKDIKLLYRGNDYLPFHKELTTFEQYKLFVLGFYSNRYTYKKYLVNKDSLLVKENNDFLFSVNAATNLSDLQTIVDKQLQDERAEFYSKSQNEIIGKKKGFKKKIFLSIISVFILAIIYAGIVKQTEKNVTIQLQEEIAAAQLDNELFLAISTGDTKKAIEYMEQRNESSYAIAEMLVDAGKYDEAIIYDEQIQELVVDKLYELGQKEKILELEVESEFISLEKQIIDFNLENLINQKTLIDNKHTLKRLGLAFLENGEFDSAKEVMEQMKTSELEGFELDVDEEDELELLIAKVEFEIEVQGINQEILSLQEVEWMEEEEDIRAEKDEQIQKLNERLIELQKGLIQLDEKLGLEDL
ncbi:hypothetical protein BTS2_3349 [Bacillus sp. TS-2]|nr:hypothetical protein BTS2_3349 [Bacillus sp. TS-2]